MTLKYLLLPLALLLVFSQRGDAGRFNPASGAISTLGARWYDATRLVSQDCDHSTDGHCRVALNDGTVLAAPADTPTIASDGARLVAWENSIDSSVHDTLGRTWPAAGLSLDSAGPDGAYALKVLRNSFGPWDVIEADGSRWRLTDGDAHDIELLGQHRAIWMIGDVHVATPGLPITFPHELTWGGRAAWIGDHFGLLYQRKIDGALVFDGHVIAPPSAIYFYSDVEFRDGRVRVTWSRSQADTDPQLIELTLAALATLPVSESTPPPPVVVPPPPPPIPAPIPPPVHIDLPNAFSVFQAAVNAHPDLLAQLRALADEGDANGWQDATQRDHAALRGRLLRYGAYAVYQQDANWGLLRKDGGSLGTRADGVKHATDILVYRPTMALVDVFDDRTPSWGPLDMTLGYNQRDPSFWIQPIPEPGTTPPPVIVPPPPPPIVVPPPVDVAPLLARIAALEQQVRDLQVQVDASVSARVQAEKDRDQAKSDLAAAQAELAKPVSCEVKIPAWAKSFGLKVGCTVTR